MTDMDVAPNPINWGPTGEVVYKRTYSRKKPDGTNETWPETVKRVVDGNLALVYGTDPLSWSDDVQRERHELREYMEEFRILPAGRHLWASGVQGRQYLFNCHVAGWGEKLSDHFEFTFLRLMEGGGVGTNYSSEYLKPYGAPRRELKVHIVCDPAHPNYEDMRAAGLLSEEFDSDWAGAFEVGDSREGWAAALTDLIDTFMSDGEVKHADRVYDVSNVRQKGARLKTFGGTASGPEPFARMMVNVGEVLSLRAAEVALEEFLDAVGIPTGQVWPGDAMKIDHFIAECVVSGGNRRSARMAILPWHDPFIGDFLACKQDPRFHWTTNISVAIDQTFASFAGKPKDEVADHELELWAKVNAVHNAVVEGMLTNGEPGYWNQQLSQVGEVGEVIATNPCGEIALEPWENCNLGHVNLQAFADDGDDMGERLARAHELVTRFLIRATYGDVNDDKQAARLARNRRIGVGHLGVQGFLALNGIPYSEAPNDFRFAALLQGARGLVRETARKYAFELRIPEPVKVTTVAPTGSIAKMPGVSEGIHPIYARYFERRVRFSLADPDQAETVNREFARGFQVETDHQDPSGNTVIVVYPTKDPLVAAVEAKGYRASIVESADEIDLDDMLAFQAMYQREYADNAVSFTANVPEGRYTVEEAAAIVGWWLPVLKGTTIMVDGTRPQAPYTRISREQYEAAVATTVEDAIDLECATGACPIR